MTRARPAAGRARGFTLLEVLVAFLILAVALAALMQTFSAGLRSSTVAETYTQAALLAKSKLAELSAYDALIEGDYQGEFDNGYGWRAIVTPYEDETFSEDDNRRLNAFRLTVTVFWGDRRNDQQITLDTLRLQPRIRERRRNRNRDPDGTEG